MIPENARIDIQNRLLRAEQEHDVRVLLAVESGSRAWGFASPNSDFDARFIYVNRPEWYLSVGLEEQRDVIEYPIVDDMDINGWDLRKALRLFWKSNPAFVEWVQSPIVYQQVGGFAAAAKALLPSVYSCEKGIYHYRSMAKTNYRSYLLADQVPRKKYFYVLRPLLAVRWLERHGTPAPIEFATLLQGIAGETKLLSAIDDLLEAKRQAPEMGLSAPIPVINAFVERELQRQELIAPEKDDRDNVLPALSQLFRQLLQEAWADSQ